MTPEEFMARLTKFAEDDVLAASLKLYLEHRKHTLSTLSLPGPKQLEAEARYVQGEASEFHDAIVEGDKRETLYEGADVIFSTIAALVMADVKPMTALYLKTMKDQGRG